MLVELDLHSGTRNRSWQLTAEESAEFLKRLAQLRPTKVGTTAEKPLGYRGLIVTAPAGRILGFDSLEISSGFVVGHGKGIDRFFLDADRALERWLFDTSNGRLDQGIRTFVAKELDSRK